MVFSKDLAVSLCRFFTHFMLLDETAGDINVFTLTWRVCGYDDVSLLGNELDTGELLLCQVSVCLGPLFLKCFEHCVCHAG